MVRFLALATFCLTVLAACAPSTTTPNIGSDGKPLPQVYRISAGASGTIQFRILDAVNVLRQAANAPKVDLNAALNAAAATHSRDM